MPKNFSIIWGLLLLVNTVSAQDNLDSLLHLLDQTIEQHDRYIAQKEARINQQRAPLVQSSISDEETYRINNQLFEEYKVYRFDSALHYVYTNLALAESLQNQEWIEETKLNLSAVLTSTGMYKESIENLHSIEKGRLPNRLVKAYYLEYKLVYEALNRYALDEKYAPTYYFKAKNYQDYRKAIQHFSCPAQNLVFACKDGDIALTTQGKLPLRRPNQGKFISDGSLSFDQWSGFIPQEQIPHEHNPSKGFVASANQHSVSPDYPYETYGYFEEYRGRFLNTKLAAMANIETKDMKALQRNNFSLKAQDFLPLMLKYINRGALSKEELELLSIFKEWNFEYTNDLVVPTIFEDWFYNFKISIYDEIVDARNAGVNVRFPEDWFLLGVIKRDTSNFIVDKASTPEKESLVDILIESFKQTYKTVPRNDKNEILKWGDMKATQIMHLARIKPFSRFNVPVDGTKDALNAVSNRYDFKASREKGKAIYKDGSSSGPSWCMVVELGNNVNGYAIYPGGQSGNPGSYYYDNMIADWAAGKYYNLLIMKDLNDGGDRVLFKQSMKK